MVLASVVITGEGSCAEGAPEGAHVSVGRNVLSQVVFAAEYPTTHVTSTIRIQNVTLVYCCSRKINANVDEKIDEPQFFKSLESLY